MKSFRTIPTTVLAMAVATFTFTTFLSQQCLAATTEEQMAKWQVHM